MTECVVTKNLAGPLVRRLENCLSEPKSELNKRRLKNFWLEVKFHRISVPAVRALLKARRSLRIVRRDLERLPAHRRLEVSKLAKELGDNSELFQFEVVKTDPHLQRLRGGL
jgi:hypothetical protein